MCSLTQPDDVPELDHVRGKWMKPQKLIEVSLLKSELINTLFTEGCEGGSLGVGSCMGMSDGRIALQFLVATQCVSWEK